MAKDDPERARRLGEALRLNLRRRKAQARGSAADPAADDRGDGTPAALIPPGAPSPR